MLRTFKEVEDLVLQKNMEKTIALAGAHDTDALSAVVNARRRGIVKAILIGRKAKIIELLNELGEDPADYVIKEEENDARIAGTACRLVAEGKADIPMKGIIQTSAFMRAILDKTRGFAPSRSLVSQATVFEFPRENRLMILTDCAINIAPEYPDKVKIIENAVKLAHKLQNPNPLVAVLAPVEVVNPSMQSTIDAAMLSKAAERGQIKGCVIDGPLALDNAISKEAARHKGIVSPVAGKADILVAPDLCSGNIFTKALTYFSRFNTAGTVNGTSAPVVMASRTDSPQDKYHTILMAIMQTL
jgi:phosphate butyryltransferase